MRRVQAIDKKLYLETTFILTEVRYEFKRGSENC
jgi:hypothetical protein